MFNLYNTAPLKLLYENENHATRRKLLLPVEHKEYYATYGLFEASLIKWCEQFGDPTKVMVDIGAHTGTYAISLAHKFASVVCFEPQKATYYALCGSVALSGLSQKITCWQIGLGSTAQCGEQTLYIPSTDGGGSSIVGHSHAPHAPHAPQYLSCETVNIRTLDEYNMHENVGFIKMDIEGNELNCLQGAIKTITTSHPKILFEANTTTDLNTITDFLGSPEINYKVVAISGYANMFIAEWCGG